MRIVVALGLGLASLLSGCANPALQDHPPALHAFRAQMTQGGGFFTLELRAAEQITDRNGESRLAYPLIETRKAISLTSITYYLDSTLHVVALDRRCFDGGDDCQKHVRRDWSVQGDLPPFGVAFPKIIQEDGNLTYLAARTASTVSFQWSDTVAGHVLKVDSGRQFPGLLDTQRGPFLYGQNRWVPDAPNVTVEKYVDDGAISGAAAWPMVAPHLGAQPWKGLLFPGEDQDDFGVGFTPREFLDAVVDFRANHGASFGHSDCFLFFQLDVIPATPDPLSSRPARKGVVSFLSGQEHEFLTYAVTGTSDLLGRKQFTVTLDRTAPSLRNCAEPMSSPWPSLTSEDFLRRARLYGADTSHPTSFWVQAYAPSRIPWQPELGWQFYHLDYEPPYARFSGAATYAPYGLSMDANTGWTNVVDTNPETVNAPWVW